MLVHHERFRQRNARKLLNSWIKLTTKSGLPIKTNPLAKCNCLIFVQTDSREVQVPFFSRWTYLGNLLIQKMLCHDDAFQGVLVLIIMSSVPWDYCKGNRDREQGYTKQKPKKNKKQKQIPADNTEPTERAEKARSQFTTKATLKSSWSTKRF